MRTSKNKLNPSLQRQIFHLLEQTLADIKNVDDAKLFLSDFLKESEFEMFAKRLAIAYWLTKRRSYANIKRNLRVSSATIASVQQSIDSEGMRFAIKNIEAEEWANKWSKKVKNLVK